MVTCKEVTDRSTDFMEGRMSSLRKLSFVAHLAMCRDCRSHLRQLRKTVALLGQLGREQTPEPVPAELMAMFRAWHPPASAVRIGRAARVLAGLEWLLGAGRSWRSHLVVLLLLVTSGALLGLARPIPGAAVPFAAGFACLGMEVMTGLLPLAAVLTLVTLAGRPVASSVPVVVAGAGALVGQSLLHFACPADGLRVHMLLFHTGGVALAMLLGLAAARAQTALVRR